MCGTNKNNTARSQKNERAFGKSRRMPNLEEEEEEEDSKLPAKATSGQPEEEDESEQESEDDDNEAVEAAVLTRSRRATAGRRLTSLVGKAAEDDQAFWGHETWVEEGSDNDSFHESDEDPDQRVDKFDSDFDDSEPENQEEEEAAGELRDAELAKLEKKNQRQLTGKYDIAKAARELGRGGASAAAATGKQHHWAGIPKIIGDGDNAGIVLNLPPKKNQDQLYTIPGIAFIAAPPATATTQTPVLISQHSPPETQTATLQQTTASTNKLTQPRKSNISAEGRPARRATEHSIYSSRFRAARNLNMHQNKGTSDLVKSIPDSATVADGNALTASGPPAVSTHSTKRKVKAPDRDKPKRHGSELTQEDLLMEAVHDTAPENHRWLLGRKRAADEMEHFDKLAAAAGKSLFGTSDKKLVERYSSKRGTLNVVSFFDMDHLPSIFTNHHAQPLPVRPQPTLCVITGKPARYRDPKSSLPFYDKHAFVELRRRLDHGTIALHKTLPKSQKQPPDSHKSLAPNSLTSSNSNKDPKCEEKDTSTVVNNPESVEPKNGAGTKLKAKAAPKRGPRKKATPDEPEKSMKPKARSRKNTKSVATIRASTESEPVLQPPTVSSQANWENVLSLNDPKSNESSEKNVAILTGKTSSTSTSKSGSGGGSLAKVVSSDVTDASTTTSPNIGVTVRSNGTTAPAQSVTPTKVQPTGNIACSEARCQKNLFRPSTPVTPPCSKQTTSSPCLPAATSSNPSLA